MALLVLGAATSTACARAGRRDVSPPSDAATSPAAPARAGVRKPTAPCASASVDFHDLLEGVPLFRNDEDEGRVAERTRKLDLGTLVLPTGRIVVGDPLSHISANEVLALGVPAGRYPVELLVHENDKGRTERVLLARVVFRREKPARWVPAIHARQRDLPSGEGYLGYPSDAATGCFVDASVVELFSPPDRVVRSSQRGIVHENHIANPAAELNGKALGRDLQATAGLPGGALGRAEWEDAHGNLIAFGLGGDMVVPSFWGLDGSGSPTELVSVIGLADKEHYPKVRWPDR